MGLLDILHGMQNGPRGQAGTGSASTGSGGLSPLMTAMLALLAYKALKGMTGQPAGGGAAPGSNPPASGQGANPSGGGLGDLLRGSLGGSSSGGLGGSLGGLLSGGLGSLLAGGAAGGVLGGALGDLLRQFHESGNGDKAQSWVGNGPNQPISPDDLAKSLGADQINAMAEHSGLSRDELLNGLSQHLPELINRLTPNGRLPTEQELSRMI